ncbi:transketolase family protein [Methylocystis echinoides]|uniref:Transketolase n=1 Tax=Methylocystis echinoides TaxID=29468 RepID=A0A9W6GTH3_9HYPH|nr:transketolase C-terminal domain-containing protein [Methylocystis echinoides]GLI92644.1 transketolase [Methylocystis echinoides]
MRDAFIETLTELAAQDPRVMLITGDLGYGVLGAFAERFPDQFLNAGVAEQNMTAIACGMALSGWRVYTYSIANFPTLRCLEQVRNDICYHDCDVTIVAVGGGFSYGQLGMSHFATEDLAIMRALPNMRVVAPTEKWEAQDLLRDLAQAKGPAYLRIDKDAGGMARRAGERATLGKARRVRDGADVTIIATGAILREALIAAERLSTQGVDCRIEAMHTIKPLDEAAILSAAAETGGVVTLEEHNRVGGLKGAVAETLLSAGARVGFFRSIALDDMFPTVVGDQLYLRARYGMDAAAVEATVLSALSSGLPLGRLAESA